MTRHALVLAGLAAALAAVAISASPVSAQGRELVGTTGSGGFVITLTQDGQEVTSLRPGTYWLTVNDLSTHHNFHLVGPGVDDVITTVPFTGTTTVKVHLEHGTYTFQCDPHVNLGMFGTFEVSGEGQD
jgi:plastocyanin